ncbi:biosynthetic-type acetolactate synthase large subunit [Ignatzschineria cameli]|uniref:Acetolactate synthase n=1 Tax=Ignatzschineria cameli TaxID=2182793 RepID=A0ABX5L332_9GAMM|nr:biosynthetic-type acetolactate synthase large subunit [Ignatzschineria cameli]PWD87304.1 biosynthetic-type acetolactate synthase large subunit [Ignatzschineria cameli]PWD91237.1 biosynthetic-type acetolactate synthase large subunit [Ignatzschineria cameli]PWD92878.1 biosynthetic-type acetolactate synthase large subunit [Ignatzschineria cameli]PWD93899.1 biosynthetic-type acetolactate synthase large subunit [Ignatzschineria cameli]
MKLSGAEIVIHSLMKEKVECIFGYPGGAVLPLYDEIYKQDKIEHVLVRHEQAATHAADAYARTTGKPGVVLVTSGPGLTNAVTGIATAYMDSIPMIVFSGQVATSLIGNDAFQEVDTVGITLPCVKHNFLVKDVKDLASIIKKAFYIATTGRPGPVVIDLPKDITVHEAEFVYPEKITMRSYNPTVKGHSKQIARAYDLIMKAKRPMVYTGGGVIIGEAHKELREFVKALNLPITSTLMGLGAYEGTDKQFLGMLGMHGTYEANMAMHHCDVLIALGARFDDRITGTLESFCPYAKIIHVDVDPSSIAKNVPVDLPIVGQLQPVLKELNAIHKAKKGKLDQAALANWWDQIGEWRAMESLKYEQSDVVIKPQFVIEKLFEVTEGKAIITSDVGQHQMWAAQYYPFDEPRQWLNSGGLGTMGFGLPAAMGAKIARPDREVACITGDGSIQMMLQELSTMLQYCSPVKIINLNNGYLGMVRQWQEFFFQKRYCMSYFDSLPDFVKLAEAYGHSGVQIHKPSDVEPALREAFKQKDKTIFLDFITDPSENVYPMIPAGKGHHEMILAGRDKMENTLKEGLSQV